MARNGRKKGRLTVLFIFTQTILGNEAEVCTRHSLGEISKSLANLMTFFESMGFFFCYS